MPRKSGKRVLNDDDDDYDEGEEEQEEEGEEEEEDMGIDDEESNEGAAAAPKRAKSQRTQATQYRNYNEVDENGDDDEGSGTGRGRRPARESTQGKRHASSIHHRTKGKSSQAHYFCQTQVETEFTFTQADAELCMTHNQPTQATLRQQDEKSFEALTTDQRRHAISDAVRYILFRASRREPITKKGLHDEVAKRHGNVRVGPLLKAAGEYLHKSFGYDIVRPPPRFTRAMDKDSLYVITTAKSSTSQMLNSYGKDVGYRGFVMVVLALIFCGKSKLSERDLFVQLQELQGGLEVKGKSRGAEGNREILGEIDGVGDVGRTLERMKKDMYIIREREETMDPEGGKIYEFHYKLGPRAFTEVGQRQILLFLAESMNQEVDKNVLREIEVAEQEEWVDLEEE